MPIINQMPASLKCHVCICGGGVTGLSLGLELAKKNPEKKIVVIESGGNTPSVAQAANVGKIIGNDVYTLEASRMRGLSGTQWMWGGNSRPFDRIDFEKRDWIDKSGWPISYDEFSKYIEPATYALDIDDANWSRQHPGLNHFSIKHDEVFEHNHFKLSPQIVSGSKAATGAFHQSKNSEIVAQKNLIIIVDHTLVDLKYDAIQKRIKSAQFLSLDLKKTELQTDLVVLAMGCLENSRILKYLSEKSTANKLPKNINIGRYFMEHPHGSIAKNLIADEQIKNYKNAYGVRIGTAVHQARYRVRDDMQQKNGLLNMGISINRSSKRNIGKLKNMSTKNVNFSVFLSEQEPIFENGLIMRNEKDMFGIPMIDLKWEISQKVYDDINFISDAFAQFQLVNNFSRPKKKIYQLGQKIGGGHHHMGTTRMGTSAQHAVVDKNCRFFGVNNLFIAGGSVFPTSGAVNPTLNMLALSYRLADHLKFEYLS